jgi:hypothetical protein
VLLVLVATIGVFTFAKPQYHPPGGNGTTLKFDDAKPPVNGWLYADATPGFHLGEHHDEWKLAMPYVPNLPAGAGLLAALRDKPGGHPEALYVPRNGCIGVQLFSGARTTLCRPHARRAGGRLRPRHAHASLPADAAAGRLRLEDADVVGRIRR